MKCFCGRLVCLWIATVILTFAVSSVAFPARSQAMDRDVKAVLVAGAYGIGGGTLLGLAAYPFAKDPRAIAIGASVGLYLGLAIGLYYVWYRDDPGNPLNPDREQPYVPEGNASPKMIPGERIYASGAVTIVHF